jgi:hypothetical protein
VCLFERGCCADLLSVLLKGAMYFTIKYLAPKERIPIFAWIDGKLSLLDIVFEGLFS